MSPMIIWLLVLTNCVSCSPKEYFQSCLPENCQPRPFCIVIYSYHDREISLSCDRDDNPFLVQCRELALANSKWKSRRSNWDSVLVLVNGKWTMHYCCTINGCPMTADPEYYHQLFRQTLSKRTDVWPRFCRKNPGRDDDPINYKQCPDGKCMAKVPLFEEGNEPDFDRISYHCGQTYCTNSTDESSLCINDEEDKLTRFCCCMTTNTYETCEPFPEWTGGFEWPIYTRIVLNIVFWSALLSLCTLVLLSWALNNKEDEWRRINWPGIHEDNWQKH